MSLVSSDGSLFVGFCSPLFSSSLLLSIVGTEEGGCGVYAGLPPAPAPVPVVGGCVIGVVVLPPPGIATVTAQEESVSARKAAAASVAKKARNVPGWFCICVVLLVFHQDVANNL